jgi:tripartite-type tricarboxylate transporter receptor subunit TctC
MIWRHGFAIVVLLASVSAASAQDAYPSRQVSLIVPFPPGNAADVAARILADKVAADLGKPFVVINRPGAAGAIGTASVAKAEPDGYTLLLTAAPPVVIVPWLNKTLSYDVERDLIPVIGIARGPFALLANKDVPVSNIAEFVAYVKANPGKTNYGSFGTGSVSQLAMETLKQAAGLDIAHIPYPGTGAAQADLLGGRIQFLFDGLPAAAARMKAGDVRVLAASGNSRHGIAPDLPIVAESGVPGLANFDVQGWVGLFAPAGTPAPIVDTLSKAFLKNLSALDKLVFEQGMLTFALPPKEFAAFVKADSQKWRKTIEEAKIEMPAAK